MVGQQGCAGSIGREMEGLMGAAARYPTANIEALQELPWPIRDYRSLEEQWEWVQGFLRCLGLLYRSPSGQCLA